MIQSATAQALENRRKLAIDLRKYQFKRERGQWLLFGTWYYGLRNGKGSTPALVIIDKWTPAARQKPCVLTLDAMFRFNEDSWDHAELARIIAKFGISLGIDMQSRSPTASRQKADLISLITDHLDDLKDIPPAPPRAKADMGEIKITINGKQVEREVKVDV